MVPPSTRMRGAPQPEPSVFHWEFRSERPVPARADGLPDPKALLVGTAIVSGLCGGVALWWSRAGSRITIDGQGAAMPFSSVTDLS